MSSLKATSFGSLRCQVKVKNSGRDSLAVYVKKGRLAMLGLPSIGLRVVSALCICEEEPVPSSHSMHETYFFLIPLEAGSTHLPSIDRQWPPQSYKRISV